jgi:predicted ATP-dependent Lon-type protease
MKEGKIKEVVREMSEKKNIKGYIETAEEVREAMDEREVRMEEKRAIHINLISATEMKAHTIEMRAEMDRKFVRCLMASGLDTREAIRRVKVWSNEWDSEKHGR